MYVTDSLIRQMQAAYGVPARKRFLVAVSPAEFDYIRSTQKHGRNHDATLYIFKGVKIVVTAKHFYPPGQYRAPSGGLTPGESFEDGARREAMEETGCEIELERFLLQTSVDFIRTEGDPPIGILAADPVDLTHRIAWRSFVFTARYASGDFEFTDRREIREVCLADLAEFAGFAEIMRRSRIGGLHYRAALHEAVAELL